MPVITTTPFKIVASPWDNFAGGGGTTTTLGTYNGTTFNSIRVGNTYHSVFQNIDAGSDEQYEGAEWTGSVYNLGEALDILWPNSSGNNVASVTSLSSSQLLFWGWVGSDIRMRTADISGSPPPSFNSSVDFTSVASTPQNIFSNVETILGLSSSTAVVAYRNGSGNVLIQGVNIAAGVPSFGGSATAEASVTPGNGGFIRQTGNNFIYAWYNLSTKAIKAIAGTYNGTSVTLGTPITILSGTPNMSSSIFAVQLSNTHGIVAGYDITDDKLYSTVIERSGTTLTAGANTDMTPGRTIPIPYLNFGLLSDTPLRTGFAYVDTGGSRFATFSHDLSGKTSTVENDVAFGTTISGTNGQIHPRDNSSAVIIQRGPTSGRPVLVTVTA